MVYFITILLLLIFVLRYDINGKKQYRNECYLLMLVIFILIAGLRYRLGIDTTRYLTRFYYKTPELQDITWSDLTFGTDPLYTLFNSVILTLGGKFYLVQILHAAFVNTLIFRYIKKHTDAIFTCIFIYFIYQYAAINMEEMRASMSLVVCLFANDYMLEKKWFKGIFLYVIGCLFHASTIVVMLMPLFFFLRLNKLGISALVGALVLGFVIQSFISDYLELIEISETVDNKVDRYVNREDHMESHKNIFGYLETMIPYGYAIISIWYMKKGKMRFCLKRLEPLMMVFLFFAMIRIGVPLTYRFVRFYVIYYVMFLAEFFVFLFQRRCNKIGKYVVYAKALVIIVPLLLLISKSRLSETLWVRYHPYSSIFDRELDHKRESLFSSFRGDRPVPGKY